VKRFGKNLGTVIKCALCPWTPPKAEKGEDFMWYNYRKYRALCEHLFDKHCRREALTNRRIVAQQKRIEERQKKSAA